MSQVAYPKKPLPLNQQVALLEARGMAISDRLHAEAVLGRINYFRFVAYAYHFREDPQNSEQFKTGTDFDTICRLIEFDTRLRMLLTDALSHIEIGFRTALCLEAGLQTGDPFWYVVPGNYKMRTDLFADFIRLCSEELARNKHQSLLKHYRDGWNLTFPPGWAMIEVLSWGCWVTVYNHLALSDVKKATASRLGCHHGYLGSWILALQALRNKCAHHDRIWNGVVHCPPRLTPLLKLTTNNSAKVHVLILIMRQILGPLDRAAEFEQALLELQTAYPEVDHHAMGEN